MRKEIADKIGVDLHQKELELFCDLLIAYAYSKIGIEEKAKIIYSDVLETAEISAMFNITAVARYLKALLIKEEAPILVNDSLAAIQKYGNQAKILYALFEKLYIDITDSDTEAEEQKLEPLKNSLKRIVG